MTVKDKAKKTIDFVLALLAVARWLPFLGQWRSLVIALSAVLGTVSGLLVKCDQQPVPSPPVTLPPSPTSTPIHIPSSTPPPTPTVVPTRRPPRIIIDRDIVALNPFTVRYDAPFKYNTGLWADKWRLGTLGKELDGTFVLYNVVLKQPGKRRLTVRDKDGVVLAEQWVEVLKVD